MSRPIPITAYDHVKVTTSNLESFEKYLVDLGFSKWKEKCPDHLENPESVWGSGEAVICLYHPEHPLAKPHFDQHADTIFDLAFVSPEGPKLIPGAGSMRHSLLLEPSFPKFPSLRGIVKIDHNTINLEMGKLDEMVDHYLQTFQLERGQFFNIHTKLTGLKSWVTRSPNYGVQIPFNEATDPKSQIQEYIEVHRGPGVQHLALLTTDIISTMETVAENHSSHIGFLDIPDTYYELAKKRVQIREDFEKVKKHRILMDGDETGYLLQIFTKNVFGAFFFELIQREGNKGFGEGNFQALFESIELDQKRRGVL